MSKGENFRLSPIESQITSIFVKSHVMSTIKSYNSLAKGGPSVFALLVDDINKMTESQQKNLWLQLNEEKISSLAGEIDATVVSHNFSIADVDAMIFEAKKNGNRKKKS